MEEYKVKLNYEEDPTRVAVKYVRCPKCDKVLNNNWECIPCNIYITFQQTTKYKFSKLK